MDRTTESVDSVRPVRVDAGGVTLEGDLGVPPGAGGVVLFAHGSGSGRHSPRNRAVARALREAGLGTLLLDLLTIEEEAADAPRGQLRFDVQRLAQRLVGAADWLAREPDTDGLPVGLFGASTGAGAALVAASWRPAGFAAVVSRGGRPDLAGAALGGVRAPTLLVVGEKDGGVLTLNEEARARLVGAETLLVVIPGASHLFGEPGALEEVARLAAGWFTRHLPAAQSTGPSGKRAGRVGALFQDRADAGRALAAALTAHAGGADVLVLALPRGGVPVAFEVARALGAPLDVFSVRKLGVPGHEELAMGAIATAGVRVLNRQVVSDLRIPEEVIDRITAEQGEELRRRERAYRGGRKAAELAGRTVLLVDDGLATGATMRAAVTAVRQGRPARVVVAVPVGSAPTCAELRELADEVVCLRTPEPFHAVGSWYGDFSQTTDEEVRALLDRAATREGREETR